MKFSPTINVLRSLVTRPRPKPLAQASSVPHEAQRKNKPPGLSFDFPKTHPPARFDSQRKKEVLGHMIFPGQIAASSAPPAIGVY